MIEAMERLALRVLDLALLVAKLLSFGIFYVGTSVWREIDRRM